MFSSIEAILWQSIVGFSQKAELEKARGNIQLPKDRYTPTVFLSHKHSELKYIQSIIGLLREQFHAEVYIDSEDQDMPKITNAVTARRIKHKIRKCQKFVFVATKDSLESPWCNWEIGWSDRCKAYRNMLIFPFDIGNSRKFNGNEYLRMYPYVQKDGERYFVIDPNNKLDDAVPLEKWLDPMYGIIHR
ncbi:MAG: toll/interleukin-1 receptor domain-containing protein [Candidatus Saccharibacteria bacterium]|nr:toll/interleukin-1 receptor domain-containing protein [Candidatus Saccharibacteria bacterium]